MHKSRKTMFRRVFILAGLMAGIAFSAETGPFAVIEPQGSLYYQVRGNTGEALKLGLFVQMDKAMGYCPKAIVVKVNGSALTPVYLIGRKPQDTIKDGRSLIFVTGTGELSVPYGPTYDAVDATSAYALESGRPGAFYTFDISNLMHENLNTIEVQNLSEIHAVTVVEVTCTEQILSPLTVLPLQKESAHVFLPAFSAPFAAQSIFLPDGDKPFALKQGADTRILWRGVPIVDHESISYYGTKPFSGLNGQVEVRTNEGWQVVNTWNEKTIWPYRKEVAVSHDGCEVELNICMQVPAYTQKEDGMVYGIVLPLDPFKGMSYSGISGRTFAPKIIEGDEILSGNTPNGPLLESSLRYLAFEGNGKKIVFDFNPEGVGSYSDYGPTYVQSLWTVMKTDAGLSLSFGRTLHSDGGVLNSKVRIFEGTMDDYLNRHAYQKYHYFSELPADLQFCFGAPKHGKPFIQAGSSVYNPEKGFGWSREPALESIRQVGALFTAATGSGEASFKCRVARPGLYIITLRSSAYEASRGPFSVSANGREIASDQKGSPFTVKDLTWSQWIEDGEFEVFFSGANWSVSSLSLQMLQHSLEDFKFRRAYWIAEGLFEPNPVLAGYNFSQPVQHDISITEIALPQTAVTDPVIKPQLPIGEVCLPDQNSPGMAWRFTAALGTMGPGNGGTFDEFDTPELIRRRLTEIKARGIDAVIVNGLLARHCFPGQLDRVQDRMKQIVAIAHELEMKIIDHQDLSLLWNHGAGFRVLCEKLGMTQRTVDGALPNRGLCLSNQRFASEYYDWLIPYILETGIDGIMIDETVFHGFEFCGCADCRKNFTEQSGLTLPLDETSPLLQNKKSTLWKTWLEWRTKTTADFKVGIRKRLADQKPDFTYLIYTTHSGFSGNSALKDGACLNQDARACDFLGTEIMSRNVMATYRATFAFRKAKNALRLAFGSPIFGLVYPMNSSDFAYFGWAMNNMNAQVTWMVHSGGADHADYYGFDQNMDHRLASSLSDVAVFYSIRSRDWTKYTSTVNSTISVSQSLSDRHIMHDFFVEESITDEFLKKYKMVILPTAGALSRKHIDTFLRYAENGGTLVLTSITGMLDSLGDDYEVWPFAEALGLTKEPGVTWTKYTGISMVGQMPVNLGVEDLAVAVRVNRRADPVPKEISHAMAGGRSVQPLVVERPLGQGRIIYSASKLASLNYEREASIGWEWVFKLNQAADRYFGQLFAAFIGDKSLSFEPVQIPRQVLTSVYRQTKEGETSTVIHFLNATGVKNTVGKKVTAADFDPAWPGLTKEIVFDIDLPSFEQAYAVSPDFKGRKPLTVKPLGGLRYRVTIPAHLIKKYSIVFIKHNESQ